MAHRSLPCGRLRINIGEAPGSHLNPGDPVRPLVTLLCTFPLLVPDARAQDICSSITNLTVGQWAEYSVTVPEMGDQPFQIRMAIVGEEAKDGTPHYWYEMKMDTPQGKMIVQSLVPGWPYEQAQIAGMIMKAGDQPAMRMSDQMIGMMAAQTEQSPGERVIEDCENAERVGTESVTVAAGTFDAVHIRSTADGNTDVWVSGDVPFGMVRMESSEGQMELVGHGDGATSSITETPQEM